LEILAPVVTALTPGYFCNGGQICRQVLFVDRGIDTGDFLISVALDDPVTTT